MKFKLVLVLIFIVSSGFSHFFNNYPNRTLFTLSGQAQGTTYTIKYIHASAIIDNNALQSLLFDINQSLSLYQSTSLICQFNAAKYSIKADRHLLKVVQTSMSISATTGACFDITSKPISNLWGFNAQLPKSIPSRKMLQTILQYVGTHHLTLQKDSLIKDNPNTQIDCDGIAQGYTVDQLSLFLRKKGIVNFMVELGGEVFTSGQNLVGTDWVIGIEASEAFARDDHFVSKNISLSNLAVTTSGSMKKYRKLGSRYWSHIVDPRTALPVDNGIVSVSVIAPDAITADAYDNAFMVMGVNNALLLADSLKYIGLYIVYVNKDGSFSDTSNVYFNRFLFHQ
jgi:thiamine biosynthesis lipoprotein